MLKFSRLTPPRFGEQRKTLYEKVRVMKNDGRFDRFYFAAINDELVIKATKDGQVLIITATDQDEAMDTDQPQQTAAALCIICQTPFTNTVQTQAMICGHRFRANCLRTSLATNLRCPNCRNTPIAFDPARIDCLRCLSYPDGERIATTTFSVSHKCKHIHRIRCQSEHII